MLAEKGITQAGLAERMKRPANKVNEILLGGPGRDVVASQREMPNERPARTEAKPLLLRPEYEGEGLCEVSPVILVEVEPKAVVDVDLVVAIAERGRGGRIDDSIRHSEYVVKPARGNCFRDCHAVNDYSVVPDLCLDDQRKPPDQALLDMLDRKCCSLLHPSRFWA